MNNDPAWANWLVLLAQVHGPAIGWAVLFGGWYFLSRDNDRRERRKEVRALLNEIRNSILSVEDQAYEYYNTHAQASQKLARKIKRDLKHLAGMITTLKNLNPNFDLDNLFNQYRQNLTGHDFESAARTERSPNDALFAEISESAVQLTSAMETMFQKSYS